MGERAMHDDKPNIIAFGQLDTQRALRAEFAANAAANGADAYTDFIQRNGRLPDRLEAAAIGRLLGKRVRAADGTLQPRPSKSQRAAAKKAREIEKAEARVDADLSRLCDAISLLAQNECDPLALIHRISPAEEEEVIENFDKAIEWLERFAQRWRCHVQNRIIEAKDVNAGNDGQARARGLYLVRCSDRSRQGEQS
jgi:hypothetical protein